MTRVTAQMSVSLDGYYAGPRSSTDPHDMTAWLTGSEGPGFFRVTRWVQPGNRPARARTIAGRPADSAGTASSSTVNLASSIVIVMRRTIVAVNDGRPPSGSVGRS
jgi:hypothetical protein